MGLGLQLIIFIVIKYLVFDGLLMYIKVWGDYYVDFGVIWVFFVSGYLFYVVGIKVYGWCDVKN